MIGAHRAAVLPLLEATPIPVVTVREIPNDQPRPYLRPYFTADPMAPSRATGLYARFRLRITLHCVGDTEPSAIAAADLAIAALVNAKPPVAGRAVHKIKLEVSPPPAPDENTGAFRVDQILVFTWQTDPA